MSKLRTVFKWRKKSTFMYKDFEYNRYVLLCGLIMFQRTQGGSLATRNRRVISFDEFPIIHEDMENTYKLICREEPLSKQEVTFSN